MTKMAKMAISIYLIILQQIVHNKMSENKKKQRGFFAF